MIINLEKIGDFGGLEKKKGGGYCSLLQFRLYVQLKNKVTKTNHFLIKNLGQKSSEQEGEP